MLPLQSSDSPVTPFHSFNSPDTAADDNFDSPTQPVDYSKESINKSHTPFDIEPHFQTSISKVFSLNENDHSFDVAQDTNVTKVDIQNIGSVESIESGIHITGAEKMSVEEDDRSRDSGVSSIFASGANSPNQPSSGIPEITKSLNKLHTSSDITEAHADSDTTVEMIGDITEARADTATEQKKNINEHPASLETTDEQNDDTNEPRASSDETNELKKDTNEQQTCIDTTNESNKQLHELHDSNDATHVINREDRKLLASACATNGTKQTINELLVCNNVTRELDKYTNSLHESVDETNGTEIEVNGLQHTEQVTQKIKEEHYEQHDSLHVTSERNEDIRELHKTDDAMKETLVRSLSEAIETENPNTEAIVHALPDVLTLVASSAYCDNANIDKTPQNNNVPIKLKIRLPMDNVVADTVKKKR